MKIFLACMLISAASAAVIQQEDLRQRRDVAEIASKQKYLPPSVEYIPPEKAAETKAAEQVEAPQDTAGVGQDGYRYKTVKRLKYRQRRDVSEITSKYLPPTEEAVTKVTEVIEAPQDTAVLAKDGYEYKTVKRLKYKQRRDVSEITPEYLPAAEEPANESIVIDAPKESNVLAQDGYRYRTIKRFRL